MKILSKTSLVFFLLGMAMPAAFSQQHARLIETIVKKGNALVIPYQKYELPNGLVVILTEDHSDPIVHVDITYHVGSAREEIGKSGFAHFFEHMMFEGSDHVASGDHFKTITAAGGTLNGSTNRDRTNYFETVPNNQLEKMIWLESDRMGFLMNAVTQQKFEIQRSTVKNERGQNYDNRPYGLVSEAVSKTLYPYGHPYSWLTIGYIEDLNKVDVNDLKRFFLRWYSPNNATLTIGGDLNVSQTLAWVEKYFGSIPRGPEVKNRVLPAPMLDSTRYVSFTDQYARLPLLNIVYAGVKLHAADQAPLDALTMIIGQGKNSILYKNFIKSRKAAQASMYSSNSELAGEIGIRIVSYAGNTLEQIKKGIDSSLLEFENKGVTADDLARFKGIAEAEFINSLASISGKVSELAASQTFTGNPNYLATELDEIRKVKAEDVMRVYKTYIKGKSAVVLSVLPKAGALRPVASDNYTALKTNYVAPDYGYAGLTYHKAEDKFDRKIKPASTGVPVIKVPPFWTVNLASGVKVTGSENKEIPALTLILTIRGGGLLAAVNPAKAGLPAIMGQLLNEDTRHLTSEQMNSALEKLGSSIQVNTSMDETVFSVSCLKENMAKTLSLLEERLLHPRFTQESLERIKKEDIQALEIARTQPASIASEVYTKILYGTDNIRTYGLSGTELTIPSITLADVQAYYNTWFIPSLSSVVAVGDFSRDVLLKDLNFLDAWKGHKVVVPAAILAGKTVPKNSVYLVDVPHAAQSEIRVGYLTGLNFDATGTYYRLGVVNYILGGGFNSRLNMDLREEKGWTYGASSAFVSGKYGGYFTASSGVRASSTDSAVVEFIKDIQEYSTKGISIDDLEFTKSFLGQSDARKYETNGQKASFLARILKFDLKPGFTEEQNRILKDIQPAEINTLAAKYLNAGQMAILVVGDKEKVEPGLKRSGFTIIELDTQGKIKATL